MKKQTGFGKGLATGLVLSALVATLGISAVAATSNRTIQVEDGFSLSINGASFIPGTPMAARYRCSAITARCMPPSGRCARQQEWMWTITAPPAPWS